MKIAVLKERRPDEARVAASPDTVKKLVALGVKVAVESGAGVAANFTDAAYREAGAEIASDLGSTLAGADVVLKVQRPLAAGEGEVDEIAALPRGSLLVANLAPHQSKQRIADYAAGGITAFAMELMPRITRAQTMDVLSSQSNLVGYQAVLQAAVTLKRGFPMMMTAAGTVPPARVLVMGAGVAGLQAIATARRLGAVVSATDVRPAAKEQVESLGATFVAVMDEEFKQAETAGGYAKEMSPEYQKKQAALLAETITRQDVVITTALIPGRPAPRLIDEAMVRSMKPGAVIVDVAAEAGGNCALTRPGETVEVGGVTILGPSNLASRIAESASSLYARNLLAFLTPLIDKAGGGLKLDWEDELVKGTALTRDGRVVHPRFAELAPTNLPAEPAPRAVVEVPPPAPQTPVEAPPLSPASASPAAEPLSEQAPAEPSAADAQSLEAAPAAEAAPVTEPSPTSEAEAKPHKPVHRRKQAAHGTSEAEAQPDAPVPAAEPGAPEPPQDKNGQPG